MRFVLLASLVALCVVVGCASDDQDEGAHETVALFFSADQSDGLDIDALVRVDRRVRSGSPADIARQVVRFLAVGPTSAEQASGLHPTTPGTRFLRSVELIDSRLIIDFKPSLLGAATGISHATADAIFHRSLSLSLFRLHGVDEIELRLDGSCARFTAYVQGEGCNRIRRAQKEPEPDRP